MRLGDLVDHAGVRWAVRKHDPMRKLVTLWATSGERMEVAEDDPACQVVAHPMTEWPYLVVRDNQRGRFIVGLTRVVRGRKTPLTLLADWVHNDPARPGGPLYLNGDLGIQTAEVLLVSWMNGPDTSVQVPVGFGTMGQKVARQTRKKVAPPTNYDRLLQDRFDEDT